MVCNRFGLPPTLRDPGAISLVESIPCLLWFFAAGNDTKNGIVSTRILFQRCFQVFPRQLNGLQLDSVDLLELLQFSIF
jgi:hypothetical protein